MFFHLRLATGVLACLLAASTARANPLAADGQWNAFDVDSFSASSGGVEWIDIGSGDALSFVFSIASGSHGTLTVVDGGFAGDSFKVYDGAHLLGSTSAALDSYPSSIGLDFDAALADPAYSHRAYSLGAGSYSVHGVLERSALLDGFAYDATVGGIKLDVTTAVPEPATAASLLAGLGLLGLGLRRRRN